MVDKVNDRLWELKMKCEALRGENPLAMWVLYAVSRHISTGRATRDFEGRFADCTSEKLDVMIKKCLDNPDKSDVVIIKTVKRILSAKR